MEQVSDIFSLICGQAPSHTWGSLPFCQRCTGLYSGAAVAVLLHLLLRPRLTGGFLWAHGGLLLLMVPFGFHWVPQGPALRAITGVLFGFGIITFLKLPLAAQPPPAASPAASSGQGPAGWTRNLCYVAGVCGCAILVPVIGAHGVQLGQALLCWLGCAGAGSIAAITLADVYVWTRAALRLCLTRRQAPCAGA